MKIALPLTQAEAQALQVGDTFCTEGIFLGLSDKKVKWTVVSTKKEKKAIGAVLSARYLGIDLGEFVLSFMNKGVSLHVKAPATV